jgi:hypothetical protein
MSDIAVIIGLGYVGFPLAREATRSGLRVIGRNTPKVIGCHTENCTEAAADFYGKFVDTVVKTRGRGKLKWRSSWRTPIDTSISHWLTKWRDSGGDGRAGLSMRWSFLPTEPSATHRRGS